MPLSALGPTERGARLRRVLRTFALALVCALAACNGACDACGACAPGPDQDGTWTPAARAPFAPGKKQVSLLFTGDLSLSRGIEDAIEKNGNNDPRFPYSDIAPLLDRSAPDRADLVFGNLETVISDSDEGRTGKRYTIRSSTKNAAVLHDVGFDVMSVSNNHALDFSHVGFWSTLQHAAAQGLLLTGVQERTGQQPLIVEVGTMKVGFLGYNAHGDEWRHRRHFPRPSLYDRDKALGDIESLRPLVDVVVVSIHWGPELSHVPWPWQVTEAHALVDAGADLIIGHHPHVAQQVEEYKGALIAYSLGDFLFDKVSPWLRHRTGARFFLRVTYDDKKRTGFSLVPVNHDQVWRPHVQPDQDTASWIAQPDTSAWRASRAVADAKVARIDAQGTHACADWEEERAPIKGGYLRWLAPRWVCPAEQRDEKQVGDSVAATGETATTIMREGVWLSPGDDTVRITFPKVPFGARLEGWAAFPDWVIENEARVQLPRRKVMTAAHVTVKSGDAVLLDTDVKFKKGWIDFAPIDTSARAGTTGPLTIEVAGARRDEPGFVVELVIPR
jgi:poly-gamma-glutamate synthesis protein (capsule biosynthesis protein)